jgi:hypothetical protein
MMKMLPVTQPADQVKAYSHTDPTPRLAEVDVPKEDVHHPCPVVIEGVSDVPFR